MMQSWSCVQGPLGPAEMVEALSAAAEAHGAEFVADRADASARVRHMPTCHEVDRAQHLADDTTAFGTLHG